jgi:purine-binding chemotaxis protein CheW
MEQVEETSETCIIVVYAGGIEIGIIVDQVSEVIDIKVEEIQDAPSFGPGVDTNYILGIGKTDNSVKMLLDIDQVITAEELSGIHSLAQNEDALVEDGKEGGSQPLNLS